jgi:hypothetical protein
MGSEAPQPESQGYLGAHDAPGKAVATTGTHLSPLSFAEHGRYDPRQEPGAVVRHAGIRGGGIPKRISLRRQPVASNAAVGLGNDPPDSPREHPKQPKLRGAEYRREAQGRAAPYER